MRIALLTTSYPRHEGDASGHFVAAEARSLIARGHEVAVLAPGDPGVSVRGPGQPTVVRLGAGSLFSSPGALPRLRQGPWRAFGALGFVMAARHALSRDAAFDRVIAHWLVPCALPASLGLRPRVEAVAHGSDVRLLLALPGPARRGAARILLRETRSIRLVSHALKRDWVDGTLPEMASHCWVQPSPIDVLPRTRAQARGRLGLDPRASIALVVSRLIPEKRVAEALGAVHALPGLRKVVVGDGPERSRLEAEFPDVCFAGELPREITLDWIASADVLLSASRLEGAPSVVREARALGVPVVCRAAGDLAAWAQSDDGLWVVDDLRSEGPAPK